MMFLGSFIKFILVCAAYFSVNIGLSVKADDCSPARKCLTCPVGLPFHCTSCEKGFHLQRGGAYLSCEPCPLACEECDNKYYCNKCERGRFGSTCQDVCANGCIDFTCDQELGLCGCKKNFTGVYCDRCISGNYGYDFNNCELKCPMNCKECESDKLCTSCLDGYYGPTCESNCHIGCNMGKCLQDNGTCYDNKCSPNYYGVNCSQCANGFYGENCSEVCPENCESCLSSTMCNDCKPGMWGAVCEKNCSYGCLNETCTQDLGVCNNTTCKPGFVGDNCTKCLEGLRGPHCNVNATYADKASSSTSTLVCSQFMNVLILWILTLWIFR